VYGFNFLPELICTLTLLFSVLSVVYTNMSTKDKCVKCTKIVKDGVNGVNCCNCDSLFHLKCACVSDELHGLMNENHNCKWFCDVCLKNLTSMKELVKSVNAYHKDVVASMDAIKGTVHSGLKDIKASIDVSNDKLALIDESDKCLNEKMHGLKNEMNSTWAEVVEREVKKNVDKVSERVSSVQKTLNDVAELRDREKNILIFQLPESSDDNERVEMIVNHLSDGSIKKDKIFKITRLGKKTENTVRPVLIKFDSTETKELIMQNVYKMTTISDNLRKVNVRYDLTKEQRDERKKLTESARDMEKNCNNGFLYRVRGLPGRWRIVKFQKKVK